MSAKTVGAREGDSYEFGGLSVQRKIVSHDTNGNVSVVHQHLNPRTLAAPLHYHHHEDEVKYVLQGCIGVMLGDQVIEAEAGSWVFMPRHQWHTFWNAGDEPCELIGVTSPAGFEEFFSEAAGVWGDVERFNKICIKYALAMDLESVPGLCERFGVNFSQSEAAHAAAGRPR